MGKFTNRLEALHNTNNVDYKNYSPAEHYQIVSKRVKRLKGFYNHLMIYLFISSITIVANLNFDLFKQGIIGDPLQNWRTYSTALFWGVGVLAHGISVFGRNVLFSLDWEERKIQELVAKGHNKEVWK